VERCPSAGKVSKLTDVTFGPSSMAPVTGRDGVPPMEEEQHDLVHALERRDVCVEEDSVHRADLKGDVVAGLGGEPTLATVSV